MELNEIANRGKLINGVIVIVNMITFITYMIGRFAYESSFLMTVQTIVRVIGGILAAGGIVYTIILMKNNEGRLKGLGLCLASCIVSLVFSVVGCMVGIAIWILSGVSMRQLDQSFKEQSTMDAWGNYAERQTQTRFGMQNGNNMADDNLYGGQNNYGGQDMYGGQNTYGSQDMYGGQNTYGGQNQYGAPQNPSEWSGYGASESQNSYGTPKDPSSWTGYGSSDDNNMQ